MGDFSRTLCCDIAPGSQAVALEWGKLHRSGCELAKCSTARPRCSVSNCNRETRQTVTLSCMELHLHLLKARERGWKTPEIDFCKCFTGGSHHLRCSGHGSWMWVWQTHLCMPKKKKPSWSFRSLQRLSQARTGSPREGLERFNSFHPPVMSLFGFLAPVSS